MLDQLVRGMHTDHSYLYKIDDVCALSFQLAMVRQRPAPHMIEVSTLRCAELHQCIAEQTYREIAVGW